jgi:branched-subunit amino acid aminotransferase/4-amino-4-deoxychorismate lyase
MRAYGGRLFRKEEHLGRLDASCLRLGLVPPARAEVEALIGDALGAADSKDSMVRVYSTPGRDGRGEPVTVVLVAELPPDLEEQRARGIRLISVEFEPAELIGGVKSTSYAVNMMALDRADAQGADDAVFLARDGTVLEATTSNVWWRSGSTLYAPSLELGILAGVTRAALMDLAVSLGYPVEEGSYPLSELAAADEAFTTSAVREVMPCVELNGKPVGEGRPGPAAAELQAALRNAACR